MADEDFYVSALQRARAAYADSADTAKVQEIDEHLRLAGVDVDKLDEPDEDKPKTRKESAPVNRRAPEKKTADAPTKPVAKPEQEVKHVIVEKDNK